MFDLDIIEEDWKNNSFSLSENEIIEIFRSEGATLRKYNEEIEEWRKNTHVNTAAYDRLWALMFHDDSIFKKEEELRKKYPHPTKKHLSEESRKKVIEGCMNIVFDATRKWYDFFDKKISQERLYYVGLEALINCTKYVLHCEEPVFSEYVYKSIERNVIKNVANWEHLSYRDIYAYVKNHKDNCKYDDYGNEIKQLHFEYETSEIPIKPSEILYIKRKDLYDVDYIKDISKEEFMRDYKKATKGLDDIEKAIISLSYDIDGYPGLTYNEIADYYDLDKKNVGNIKKKALRKLRKNARLNEYI